MRPAPFTYERATSVPDAVAALASGATALAGGQSLVPLLKRRLLRPGALVDLNAITELQGLSQTAGGDVVIGSMTRHEVLARAPELAGGAEALREAAGRIADPQVRARGTIGGSLCAADPRANLPAALIALEADVLLVGSDGRRRVAVADLFAGPGRTVLAAGELLVAVLVPAARTQVSSYDEVTVQPNGVPIVNVGAARPAGPGGLRLAVGGLCRTPWRALAVEAAIAAHGPGRPAVEAALREAVAARGGFEDLHGDAGFRLAAAAALITRAVRGLSGPMGDAERAG